MSDPVWLDPDWVCVELVVPLLLPPVSPPRAPLPPEVCEPLLTLPPLPALPVEPELPEPAVDLLDASPPECRVEPLWQPLWHPLWQPLWWLPLRLLLDAELPPVEPLAPDEPPFPAEFELWLLAAPPLPPLPPLPDVTVLWFVLDPVEWELPPRVSEELEELPPVAFACELALPEPPLELPPSWCRPWCRPAERVLAFASASPPRPDEVDEPVLLSPDLAVVSLLVELWLPPVSPPRAPLPPVVVEALSTLPPLPPLPVDPELPDDAPA